MSRCEHIWTLRPPPGARFMRALKDGAEVIMLDFPAKPIELPMPKDMRHFIKGADIIMNVPYHREREVVHHFRNWLETEHFDDSQITGILYSWFQNWIDSYFEPQMRMAEAMHAKNREIEEAAARARALDEEHVTSPASPLALQRPTTQTTPVKPAASPSTIGSISAPAALPEGAKPVNADGSAFTTTIKLDDEE